MKLKKLHLAAVLITSLSFAQQNYWSKVNNTNSANLKARTSTPKQFALYKVDLEKIKIDLAKASQRFSSNSNLTLKFPDSDGNFKDYIVQEASVMEPELQAKFPEIKSYVGWQKNDASKSIRFSLTPTTGISIMYFDNSEISYLDSYAQDNSSYILYKRKDLPTNAKSFECSVENSNDNLINNAESLLKAPLVTDGKFRTYRLALSATGEYTVFHGGTVEKAMAAMATTMTRVNGIYEKNLSLTMVMVANNNLIVYTNPSTDPFTNGNPNSMISQNQSNTNTVIGAANYDIGHVFGTNSGGLAGLGVVCTTSKARGVTGSGAPINDPFDIDYVAHEMGHQFGANHTFRASSGSCSGNANSSTAYEPGSGSTIMAYAGICGVNNIQANSDAYFHAASVTEMYAVLQRSTDCAVKYNNNNLTPTANAGQNYTIPKGTAFVLTGLGTDPDNDPITYLWEQYNNQTSTQPPVSTSTAGPVYRSLTPTISPKRYFPNMASVLANNLTPTWEVTPSVARTLNFSLLVNDNKPTGNQSAKDAMEVTVTNDGPFKVTSHTSNSQYIGSEPTTIKWDVAGTNQGAINTSNVEILMSKDNGANFDIVLAQSTPNNGSATVTLPNENIASARIMIKAIGNIYFAVNSSNFSIKEKVLSIANNDIKALLIYPNPSREIINIQLKNNSDKGEYTIYDTTGRQVKKGSINNSISLKTTGLNNGNYIINIVLENGEKYSEKLIIKK